MRIHSPHFSVSAMVAKMCIVFALIQAASQVSLYADQSIKSDDLGKSVAVIGQLGKPLGTVMTIEGVGTAVTVYSRADETASSLHITKVDGVKLDKPLLIGVIFRAGSTTAVPKAGKAMTFVGYEAGSFIGTPALASKYEGVSASTNAFHFATFFKVLK